LELRHLKYFLKIAETSSFTRAAAALRVTQPTLSHQVKQLEQEISIPLFDRVGRQVRLTGAGKVFQEYARRSLMEIESGLRAISELDGLIRGQLTVGVFRTFSSSPLPEVLARFSRSYPGVHVVVKQLSLRDIERELIEGGMNVAIAYLPPASDRIVTEPVFAVPLALVINTEHPLFGRKRVNVKDLNGQPLVLLSEEFPLRQLIDRRLAHHGVKPRIVMEMNSNEAVLSTVRSGPLATILTERVLSGGELHSVELEDSELTRTAAIFWARDSYRPAAARILADMVKQAYTGAEHVRRGTHTGSRG
jgi:LysR family transcriptional regulator, cyn operon transcriptional activator